MCVKCVQQIFFDRTSALWADLATSDACLRWRSYSLLAAWARMGNRGIGSANTNLSGRGYMPCPPYDCALVMCFLLPSILPPVLQVRNDLFVLQKPTSFWVESGPKCDAIHLGQQRESLRIPFFKTRSSTRRVAPAGIGCSSDIRQSKAQYGCWFHALQKHQCAVLLQYLLFQWENNPMQSHMDVTLAGREVQWRHVGEVGALWDIAERCAGGCQKPPQSAKPDSVWSPREKEMHSSSRFC